MNYVRHGRDFGRRNGVAVAPVELAPNGRFRPRAMTGEKPRAALTLRSALVAPAKAGLELLRYLMRIAIALVGLVAAALPFRAMLRAANAFSLRAPDLVSWAREKVESASDVAYIDPGVGDVVLCPNGGHEMHPAIYEAFRAQGAEIVSIVHDLLPVTLPSYHVYPWRWKFEKNLSRSLDYVSHYYCISNKTLLDLTDFAAQRRKTLRASVAYNGFEPSAAGQAGAGGDAAHAALLRRRPWLMVGTLEPKKGYPEALAAFEALWAAGYRRPLAIVGRRGWMFDEIVENLEASPWWGKRLFWFGKVSDEGLVTFYRRSHALLFSSFAEGFGLPLVEAVSHGLPILARDTPTSREILGSRGVFFTTTDELTHGVKSFEDPATYGMARDELMGLDWFDWRSVIDGVMTDIMRPPQERRTGADLLDRSLMRPVWQAPRRPIIRVAEDDASAIGDFLSLLAPHSVAKFLRIRVGGDYDGGYVMLDDFAGISAALSLGAAASWDAAIADRGIRVLQFDDGVDGAPVAHDGCAFHRTRIVPLAPAGQSETTIEAILAEFAPSRDLLLRMDIGGDEWSVLDASDQASIGRFRQIACEFHDLDRLGDPKWRLLARGALEKLCRTHCVLHVHGNNYAPLTLIGSRLVPKVIEIAFVRRDAYEICASTDVFPTVLDSPNDAAAPDLFLGTFRFK